MNILLTNDDGYLSTGITLLKKLLLPYGRVVIVAPSTWMSAKSCSITLGHPISINKIDDDFYSCSGTPADCVSFALSSLNIDFDLVISGINHGLNISYDTMYSGTVGACLEALTFHKKAMAISTNHNFDLVAQFFPQLWDFVWKHQLLSEDYLLNINFPIGDKVQDIALGQLYYRHDRHYFEQREDGYWANRETESDFVHVPDSDCYQVTHDIVSIVPLTKSYFSSSLYEELLKRRND